jgi:hypothetical protein
LDGESLALHVSIVDDVRLILHFADRAIPQGCRYVMIPSSGVNDLTASVADVPE